MTSDEMERLWDEHLAGEFLTRDVEATLDTMVDDAVVDHVPVHGGGRGKDELRAFYRDVFIPSWPDDLRQTSTNRVVGAGQIVDEIRTTFTHDRPMEWFLPGVAPTHKVVAIDIVVVVHFRDGKIAAERIYWDQATVLRQIGRTEPPARRSARARESGRFGLTSIRGHTRPHPIRRDDPSGDDRRSATPGPDDGRGGDSNSVKVMCIVPGIPEIFPGFSLQCARWRE